MAERNWFFTSGDRQEGPLPESQLKSLIASGQVTANTLVWSEGMPEWRRAADIPGLMSVAPPSVPPAYPPLPGSGAYAGAPQSGFQDGHLSSTFTVWGLFWRSIVYMLGIMLVVPAPWAATAFYRWAIAQIQVPGRPAIGFTGKPGDIWWAFVLTGLCIWLNQYLQAEHHYWYLTLVIDVAEWVLSWMILKWVVANISSDGRPLPLQFIGEVLPYVGWQLLLAVSFFTIIGWAWVTTAWTRWMCRNIEGTRREIIFTGTGWEVLWRVFVIAITAIFIIPNSVDDALVCALVRVAIRAERARAIRRASFGLLPSA